MRRTDQSLRPSDIVLIDAEFLRQVYVAERMRLARLAGQLPVPPADPLGRRLWRLAHPELAGVVQRP